jgi:hypothetical protein
MQALAYWKAVTADRSEFLDRVVGLLTDAGIRFCVIGGQGVNAYVEPVVSLDLDLAVASDDLPQAEALLASHFAVRRFPHSVNVGAAGSDLRVQLQTDPRYAAFVADASPREILGLRLPVATVEAVMQGKVWAAQDSQRRASKRQKDLADIARLLEAYPDLERLVPSELRARLL